jgi:hypothetical protein
LTAQENAPSFKANKGIKFYNAGDRISEAITFSLPGTVNANSGNLLANWHMDAPAASFFQVPTEIRLQQDLSRINVDFATTVLQRFADRGVIMIDEEWDAGDDEERAERFPFAVSDEAAKVKGEAKWIKYLQTIVKNHINACDRARAAGGFPLEAQGFTKRALKLLNMQDPAATAFDSFKKQVAIAADAPQQVQSAEATQLRAELAETQAMLKKVLDRLAAKEQLDDQETIEEQASPNGKRGQRQQNRQSA